MGGARAGYSILVALARGMVEVREGFSHAC